MKVLKKKKKKKKKKTSEKDYIYNPATFSCKYVGSIINDSVITCDEVIEETKTFPTNFNEKRSIFYLPLSSKTKIVITISRHQQIKRNWH